MPTVTTHLTLYPTRLCPAHGRDAQADATEVLARPHLGTLVLHLCCILPSCLHHRLSFPIRSSIL